MDIKEAIALSLLGIKKEDVEKMMNVDEDTVGKEDEEDKKEEGGGKEDGEDDGEKDEDDEEEIVDYKKMYEQLIADNKSKEEDLKKAQDINTKKNNAGKEDSTSIEKIFRDVF